MRNGNLEKNLITIFMKIIMIKTLKIKNFECWKDVEFDFHPGINIIVGNSDKGKSSIVRAIEYNCKNKPSGTDFRPDALTDSLPDKKIPTLVEITYKTKKKLDVISRERNLTGINEYRINGKSLVALRTDLPNEVFSVSKMSEINILSQHPDDQYFLLSKKPGQVAKELNKVSGLEIMDKAIADINSQVRTAKAALTLYEKETKETLSYLTETEWAEKAEELKIKILIQEKEIDILEFKKEKLLESLKDIKTINSVLSDYKSVPFALVALKKLQNSKQEIKQKEHEIETLKNSVISIKKIDLKIKAYADIQNSLNTLKTIKNQAENIQLIQNGLTELKNLIHSIKTKNTEIQKATEEYELIYSEYVQRIKTEICPVCGRKD